MSRDRVPADERGVTVIGGVQADVVVRPVTELPPAGATRLTEEMSIRVGGAGANAALAFVETGLPVRLMGCVGEDRLGDWMRQELTEAGLVDELAVLPGRPTGLTVALESDERDRTFLTHLGVNADWVPGHDPGRRAGLRQPPAVRLLRDARAAGRGGAVAAAAPRARPAGAPSSTPRGIPRTSRPPRRAEVRGLLSSVDVFLPNEAEACAIARTGEATSSRPRARSSATPGAGWWSSSARRGCMAVGPDEAELSAERAAR